MNNNARTAQATDLHLTAYASFAFALLAVLAVLIPLMINAIGALRTTGTAL
jgi:hypothetical protein